MWILQPSRISEVTGETEKFYQYRVLAGGWANHTGQINKTYLSQCIASGWAEIITNPLEAYAWEAAIKAEVNQ